MPITINLGRINKCKIVGTTNRFIEVRCNEQPIPESWDCIQGTGPSVCIDPGTGNGQYSTLVDCQAAPCGGPIVSFDCVTGATGPECIDPGTGNGVYPTLVDCNTSLANGSNNSCNTNSTTSVARINGVPGMIFNSIVEATEYYTNPVNNISGIDANTLYFEIYSNNNCNQFVTLNTTCCQGPNSTVTSPTHMAYIPYMYINYPFIKPGIGSPACDCDIYPSVIGGPGTSLPLTNTCVDSGKTYIGFFPTLHQDAYNYLATNGYHSNNIFDFYFTSGQWVNAPNACVSGGYVERIIFMMSIWNYNVSATIPASTHTTINSLVNELFNTYNITVQPTDSWLVIAQIINNSTAYANGLISNVSINGAPCQCTYGSSQSNSNICRCCPEELMGILNQPINALVGYQSPQFFIGGNADYLTLYGMTDIGVTQSWSWQDILQDAITAGVTGITVNTPYSINGINTDPGTFISLVNAWLLVTISPAPDLNCHNTSVDNNCVQDCNSLPRPTACSVIDICVGEDICECIESCSTISYDCDPKIGCYDPGTGLGLYTGSTALADCQAVGCNPTQESWNCNNGGCMDPGDGTGTYSTLANCAASFSLCSCIASGMIDSGVYNPISNNACNGSSMTWVPGNGTTCVPGFYDFFAANSSLHSVNFSNYYFEQQGASSSGQAVTTCQGPNGGGYLAMQYMSVQPASCSCCPQETSCYANNTNPLCVGVYHSNINTLVTFLGTVGINVNPSDTWATIDSAIFNSIGLYAGGALRFGCGNNACWNTCGVIDTWDCVQGNGGGSCVITPNGPYATELLCQQSTLPTSTCDGKTLMAGSPYVDITALHIDLTTIYAGVDPGTLSAAINPPYQQTCRPPLTSTQTHCIDINNNFMYTFGPYFVQDANTGNVLPGFTSTVYYLWSDFLTEAIALSIPGISATTNIFDAKTALNTYYSNNVIVSIEIYSNCCYCEVGCSGLNTEPVVHKECLTLWLHADRLDSIKTIPPYPVNGPFPINTTYYISEWFNLAYDASNGVYPYDPNAYYTYDTIINDFTTAPILDTTTFSPLTTIMFDETSILQPPPKYLIANPSGPNVFPLEPDTNPVLTYEKGWSVFFYRCTTEEGWANSKSWFMGDDWTQSSPGSENMASGLKPDGHPYCRSLMFGHNHADESVPNNEYESSFINEFAPSQELYLEKGCYLHWIVAKETLPVGDPNNTFDVTWGIGYQPLFKDTLRNINQDLILQNINTRNRNKNTEAQAGWYKEIRAYNCAFNAKEIQAEISNIENYWGPSQVPTVPHPCTGVKNGVISFDGISPTRVEVVETGGNTTILPSTAGFTAVFWVRMNDCLNADACFFEKGINLPDDNDKVAFRLYMNKDVPNAGDLFWDVFGDEPSDYVNNYSRTISNISWLGESSCNDLINKWKHVAVTMEGVNGINRKIYINGVDQTGVTGGALQQIEGKVKRNFDYPLVIGDSSRASYSFKGDFSQFKTWNIALSSEEIFNLYNNANVSDSTEEDDRLTFYSNFNSTPITHETAYPYTITPYGGITIDKDSSVANIILPTEINGLLCWFKAGSNQLFDRDVNDNIISRATYMLQNLPRISDKLKLWECHGKTGRYVLSGGLQNSNTSKVLYEKSSMSNDIQLKGLYHNVYKELRIFHTKNDGGLDFPVADGINGAFTIMIKLMFEGNNAFTTKSLFGNTTSNMVRLDNSTTLRVKVGTGAAQIFTIPSALTSLEPYIVTVSRDVNGIVSTYINGGSNNFVDQILTLSSGNSTDIDAFTVDYIGGVPTQRMIGWIFDFLAWSTNLNPIERKAQYDVINESVNIL